MQNFGGTAKSILVFVKKAYSDIKGIEGNQSEVVVIVQKNMLVDQKELCVAGRKGMEHLTCSYMENI